MVRGWWRWWVRVKVRVSAYVYIYRGVLTHFRQFFLGVNICDEATLCLWNLIGFVLRWGELFGFVTKDVVCGNHLPVSLVINKTPVMQSRSGIYWI